ncbi:dead-box helicase dbp80 [Anaeramoeba flamelloides]|uniref:Dead-box helicase dbp80 n=1 Tax=Anaeramoeba flamelloides TaxID=1746091 RepID=A0AAV7ZLI1_9EUKA|nr:dead-box helicase dbp80 [Anaeramoeba flamelloides]
MSNNPRNPRKKKKKKQELFSYPIEYQYGSDLDGWEEESEDSEGNLPIFKRNQNNHISQTSNQVSQIKNKTKKNNPNMLQQQQSLQIQILKQQQLLKQLEQQQQQLVINNQMKNLQNQNQNQNQEQQQLLQIQILKQQQQQQQQQLQQQKQLQQMFFNQMNNYQMSNNQTSNNQMNYNQTNNNPMIQSQLNQQKQKNKKQDKFETQLLQQQQQQQQQKLLQDQLLKQQQQLQQQLMIENQMINLQPQTQNQNQEQQKLLQIQILKQQQQQQQLQQQNQLQKMFFNQMNNYQTSNNQTSNNQMNYNQTNNNPMIQSQLNQQKQKNKKQDKFETQLLQQQQQQKLLQDQLLKQQKQLQQQQELLQQQQLFQQQLLQKLDKQPMDNFSNQRRWDYERRARGRAIRRGGRGRGRGRWDYGGREVDWNYGRRGRANYGRRGGGRGPVRNIDRGFQRMNFRNNGNKKKKLTVEEEKKVKKFYVENNVQLSKKEHIDLVNQKMEKSNILQSPKTFEDLGIPKPLLKAVYELNYKRPSKIQAESIPYIIQGLPFAGQSQSGTGKTLAYSLGMLSRCNEEDQFPQVLCFCPTRELAIQVVSVVQKLTKWTKLKIFTAIQGNYRDPSNYHVIIGTPGTIMRLKNTRKFRSETIKMIVIDEADELLVTNTSTIKLLNKILKEFHKKAQMVFFSATFPAILKKILDSLMPNRKEFTIEKEKLSLDGILQLQVKLNNEKEKFTFLKQCIQTIGSEIGSIIIFVNTKVRATYIETHLQNFGFPVSKLTGDLDFNERDYIMDQFRSGKTRILIATNVLSRGIDVLSVSLVINYDIPQQRNRQVDCETYLHRIGRSGRYGNKGATLNFLSTEMSILQIQIIEKHFKKKIRKFNKEDVASLKQILAHYYYQNKK